MHSGFVLARPTQPALAPMKLDYSTPALLFPTLSLILLAYTNRFMSLAKLIRDLHASYLKKQDPNIISQIKNLQRRILLVRNMTATGISSIFMCVGCMFLLHRGEAEYAVYAFNIAMLLMLLSLAMSLVEIIISTQALSLELSDIKDQIGSGITLDTLNQLKQLNPLGKKPGNDAGANGGSH